MPVGVGHEDVRDGVLAVRGPDPDAVAVQLVPYVGVPRLGVVVMYDGQGVGMGHRELTGPCQVLGQPRCGHAAGAIGTEA